MAHARGQRREIVHRADEHHAEADPQQARQPAEGLAGEDRARDRARRGDGGEVLREQVERPRRDEVDAVVVAGAPASRARHRARTAARPSRRRGGTRPRARRGTDGEERRATWSRRVTAGAAAARPHAGNRPPIATIRADADHDQARWPRARSIPTRARTSSAASASCGITNKPHAREQESRTPTDALDRAMRVRGPSRARGPSCCGCSRTQSRSTCRAPASR